MERTLRHRAATELRIMLLDSSKFSSCVLILKLNFIIDLSTGFLRLFMAPSMKKLLKFLLSGYLYSYHKLMMMSPQSL